MANNEKTRIPCMRYGAMAVLFLLFMVPGILADEYVGGVPPQTVRAGTVSGGLYVDASLDSFSQDVEKTFTAIPDASDIDWARLYVAVYCGHMQNNYQGSATVSFDGNGDGTFETALATEDLNVSYVYEFDGGTTPVVVNDHCNRVTSDYLMWYDVTSLITAQAPKAHVETAKVNPSFDGRIKALTLVVAYNDGDSDQVHYWVNQGHDVDSYYADNNGLPYTGESTFDLSGISGAIDSATLTVNHLASTDGTYAWNGNPIPTDPATGNFQGGYYGYNIWDVTSGIISGYSNDLTYDRVDQFYKITLATLAAKEAASCDLEPTFVNPDAATVFAKEPNRVRVNVKNNGPDESPATEVRLTSTDGVDVRETVPAIAAGATTPVYVIDPTIRTTEGGTVTYTATVDPDNTIPETDEDNNQKDSLARDVKFNGYKGKRYWDGSDVTTQRTFDLRGDLVFSSGDSVYKQGGISGGSWTDYTVTWTGGDLPIPAGAAVEEARLYVPYTWDNSSQVPDHFSATFNGNLLPDTTWYKDDSNYGGYDDYFYGLLAYDVTSYFSASGNSAIIHKDDSGSNLAMYGLTLAVMYADENATRKQIFLNEEFDLLGADATMYATTPEEATAYVPFSGMTIDPADVVSADLVTFVPSGNGPEGDLLFNGATLATNVWDYGSTSGTQVAVDSRDVKASLLATGNEAAIRCTDGATPVMAASHVFLVVEYKDAGAPDLVVTGILPNVGAGDDLFASEPNMLSVNVTNIGDTEAGPSTLLVDIAGSEYTSAVGSLAAGAYEIVTVTDTVSRAAGPVIVTATVDSAGGIAESNETNNGMTVDLTVYNNGYKGKRWTDGCDLTTQATFDGQYDVVYSAGDTAYTGASWTETTYSWTSGDLPIPVGATVVDARLYQGYTYNKMGVDPAFTMMFNGNITAPDATYQDIKGFGSYSYPYGMYVYDVTGGFDPAGNSMTITPETGNNYGIYGAYLVVVYEDPSAGRKAVWINEEFDMLYSRASYSVDDTEATAYAPFSGVETTGMESATAVAVLASAGDADKSRFFFNDQEYTGFWADYLGGPQVGFSAYDVTGAIAAGENEARFQSHDPGTNGDNMYAMTGILVVEYEDSGAPDLVVTGILPNVGAGDDMFASEPNMLSVNVTNIGDAEAGPSTLLVDIAGSEYTSAVGSLAAGASEIVTVTDTVSRAAGEVTVTATADSAGVIAESNETNNGMTVDLTVYNNGYKGKRWTDGSDLTTQATFDGHYDVVYSAGDTAYTGSGWTESTFSWTTGDLPIPAGATVVDARLYQGYTYNKMGVDPAFTMMFNGAAVTPEATYQDIKGFGSYSYPYGMYVYDVTGGFDPAGNSMTITPETGNNYGIYGAYLVVVYEDPSAGRKAVWINEEFDMLYSRASYSVDDTEATAYAPFSGVETTGMESATAVAILASAGDADKSRFFFNDQEYTGFWADYLGGPQVGFSAYDVTDDIASGENVARLQSHDPGTNGDNMYAMTGILVVEYEDSGAADLVITEILPNMGAGNDLFASEPNELSVNVTNIGDADAGSSTLLVDIAGTEYTSAVGSLAAGASEIVAVTDTVSRAAGEVTVTATADSAGVIAESNETNNGLTVDLTVYNNGYKGKRWTDGSDLTTQATFDGHYDVVYSAGDTAYTGSGWTESTFSWTAGDLPIPAGATVVDARLYQGYTYNKMGVDPAFTMTFNGAAVTPEATYQDIKGFGSYSYPYGMYVYDVTGGFDPAGNSMTITPETGNNYGIYGAYLVVVYEDDTAGRKAIWVNEEFDMLYSRSSYSVNDAEATAYAPFSGVETTGMEGATAVAILASAGDADKSAFFFNSQEYTGFWTDYLGGPQVGFSTYDVTGAIAAGNNEARFQSHDPGTNGDNMYAMTGILVVEYTDEPGYPVMLGTGWSLFSTPVLLSDGCDSFGEIFADLPQDSVQIVLGWGDGQWYIPSADDRVKPLDAYYIKTTEPGEVFLFPSTAVSPIPSRSLTGGISLIGPAPACEGGEFAVMPVEEALISIQEASGGLTGYTIAVSPGHNQPSWVHVAGGDSRDILPFKGYWVVMENPDTLYGFSTTPTG